MAEKAPHHARVYQHVRTFERALQAYEIARHAAAADRGDSASLDYGVLPLARFLSGYFKENRQMGSKDRRAVSNYLYRYYRLGQSVPHLDRLQRLVLAEFLCTEDSLLVAAENPTLHKQMHLSLEEKVELAAEMFSFKMDAVFPWPTLVSDRLDRRAFAQQFLVQPDLYIRIRRGREKEVKNLLDKHELRWRDVGGQALALANGTSLNHIPGLKGLVEVQDWSSQRSLEDVVAQAGEKWWDACSGAGGKSLLLWDTYPGVELLVSDVRTSILKNLQQRFKVAGVDNFRAKRIDLTQDISAVMGQEAFDGILLDVPCTGSGTWGRTPEMLTAFDAAAIPAFTAVQRNMAGRVIDYLRPGGQLVYITCSVFQEENEAVVDHLLHAHPMTLFSVDYKIGYLDRADTLFVAILQKNV